MLVGPPSPALSCLLSGSLLPGVCREQILRTNWSDPVLAPHPPASRTVSGSIPHRVAMTGASAKLRGGGRHIYRCGPWRAAHAPPDPEAPCTQEAVGDCKGWGTWGSLPSFEALDIPLLTLAPFPFPQNAQGLKITSASHIFSYHTFLPSSSLP